MKVLLFFLIIIYLTKAGYYYSKRLTEESYSQVFSRSNNNHESGTYKRNHDNKLSLYSSYTHIYKLILNSNKYKNEIISIVEHQFGKPKYYLTYKELANRILKFSYSLNNFDGGVPTVKFDEERNNGLFRLLGLYGNNSANWIVTDLAAMKSGITTLVVHSKFNINEVVEIFLESKIKWLCIDLNLVEDILNNISKLPNLKNLIILDLDHFKKYTDDDDHLADIAEERNEGKNSSITNENPIKKKKLNETNNLKRESEAVKVEYADSKKITKLNVNDKAASENKDEKKNEKKDEKKYEQKGEEYQIYIKLEKEKLLKLRNLKKMGADLGVKIIEFEDLITDKMENDTIANDSEDFITTIVHTSGTNGNPKGVMLSNGNFYYTLTSLISDDLFENVHRYMSYLPISHVYERVNVLLNLLMMSELHIWSKDVNYFLVDLLKVKPQILTGVPKVFYKLYNNIKIEIDNLPKIKRFFVNLVLKTKRLTNNRYISKILESLTGISKRIKSKFDDKLIFMINGGGKISEQIEKELHILLDTKIYQGYGLTETTGPIFLQSKKDMNYNTVGAPISSTTIFKLQSWECYDATDKTPRGELLIKSNQIFQGYFLRKNETKNSFTEDNFFKTGDIFKINDNGTLTFIDRSKGLIKVSNGEYIETEFLNNIYIEIPFINYCVVYGNESLDGPIAIISIDKQLFVKSLYVDKIFNKELPESNVLKSLTEETINEYPYNDYVKEKMSVIHNKYKLNKYNEIRYIYLTIKDWNFQNYLTPTFKVKRFKVFNDYNFFIQKNKDFYVNSKLKLMNKI